jgi:Icc-related predicted phosphoesterase
MRILAVSDQEIPILYSPHILERFREIDLVIGCGDLSYSYQEYIHSMLNCPLYYVRGNHAVAEEFGVDMALREPPGGVDLHGRVVRDREKGLLLAGIEGSLLYNYGRYQYSQADMWQMVWSLVPMLLWNKLRYGRYLDIFVSHAPPFGIHDKEDLPHQGIKAFRWLIDVFKPAYHLHGHIHIYRQDDITETAVKGTQVINTYGYRLVEFS